MIHDSVQDMEESVQAAARREMMRITSGAKLPGILLRSSFLIMMIIHDFALGSNNVCICVSLGTQAYLYV